MASTNTPLKNRILWYDGSMTMTPDQIVGYLLAGNVLTDKVYVTDINDEAVKKYNIYAENKLKIKNALTSINTEWNVPDKYKKLHVEEYIYKKLLSECENRKFNDDDVKKRIARTKEELKLFEQHNISDLLKTLIYVVDTFKENKVVWGTGRGSSCSSYLLYLIRLHDVDSVKYDLNINEFIR
jgi:DNA polymerase III alpha subunit